MIQFEVQIGCKSERLLRHLICLSGETPNFPSLWASLPHSYENHTHTHMYTQQRAKRHTEVMKIGKMRFFLLVTWIKPMKIDTRVLCANMNDLRELRK